MNREELFSQWEIVLYLKLLDTFNVLGWQSELRISNRRLMYDSGLTLPKLIEARNGLVARNLLVFESGQTRKECSVYSLITEAGEAPAGIPVVVRQVMDDFNRICTRMPAVNEAGSDRIEEVQARLMKYDRWKIVEIFRLAADSDYLNGKNNKGWIASFDWLMKESNFTMVAEGNFNNRQSAIPPANASVFEVLQNINESILNDGQFSYQK